MSEGRRPPPSGGGPRETDSPLESTQTLLGRVAGGDREALDRLYSRYLSPLQRWARGRLPLGARSLLETDDLVQDTLLGTLRGIERFEPEHSGAFQAYLRRGILNRIRDEIRRLKRRPQGETSFRQLHDPEPSPLEQAIGQELLDRYEAALLALDPGDREAVVARLELGLSYREVAEAIGKPSPDAARMAVRRAVLRLAREMSVHG